jgi:hypothetical protein
MHHRESNPVRPDILIHIGKVHQLREPVPRTVDPALDGSYGTAADLGCLLVGET